MLTKEQKIEMFSMKLDGKTFQEIAAKFSISTNQVRSILSNRVVTQYKYPNLANWLKANNLTQTNLATMTGFVPSQISLLLLGRHDIRKSTIDAILNATGLTYEVAFSEEKLE